MRFAGTTQNGLRSHGCHHDRLSSEVRLLDSGGTRMEIRVRPHFVQNLRLHKNGVDFMGFMGKAHGLLGSLDSAVSLHGILFPFDTIFAQNQRLHKNGVDFVGFVRDLAHHHGRPDCRQQGWRFPSAERGAASRPHVLSGLAGMERLGLVAAVVAAQARPDLCRSGNN